MTSPSEKKGVAGGRMSRRKFLREVSAAAGAIAAPFLVPASAGGRPKNGAALKVVPVDDASRTYEARVKLVSPTIDPASGSYDVTAQLTQPDLNRLRPGMAVKVLWPAARRAAEP